MPIAILNIVSQPHSVDFYIDAFETLCNQKVKVLYHVHRYIEIGSCTHLDDERLPNALTGYFFVFSQFNFDDPWLNLLKNTEATEKDLEALSIPPHLAPEFRRFRYIFDVRKHRLYFEKLSLSRQSLSQKAFAQCMNKMLHDSALSGKFTEINAFVIPDEQAVEQILSLTRLRRLFIKLHRPNPDDEDFEKEILESLNAEHVSISETNLIKAPGEKSIAPSNLTKKVARLASKFGQVIGWGRNEQNAPIKVDTESHPKEHTVVFKETESALDKMVEYIANKNEQEAEKPLGGDV